MPSLLRLCKTQTMRSGLQESTFRPSWSCITLEIITIIGTLSLHDQILEVYNCQTNSHFTSYLTQWSASSGPPPDPMPSSLSGTNLEFYPSFFGRSVSDGMLLGFSGATQWRLAAGPANRQLRTPARRRGSMGGCWPVARTNSLCPPQMSLRVRRRRPGPTCHGLQESTW